MPMFLRGDVADVPEHRASAHRVGVIELGILPRGGVLQERQVEDRYLEAIACPSVPKWDALIGFQTHPDER